MPRLTSKLKEIIRAKAIETCECYSATLAYHEDAPVVKHTRQHLDPDVPPTPGYLVQAWIFVSEEELEN